VVSSQARRAQITFAIGRGHSQRRAGELLEVPRALLTYRPVRSERDAPVIEAMKRLAIDVAGSIRSRRVIDEVLSRLVSQRGAPRFLRSDNDPEFVSTAILEWIVGSNIEIALIDPDKPWQNGTDESFNGKLRDECLSVEWFRLRREAKVIIDAWREHYNLVRPHSSLEFRTPIKFRRHHDSINPGAILR